MSKPRKKTALGVDISEKHVSLALLRIVDNKPELIKSGTSLIPTGAVSQGIIKDPSLLQKTISDLKSRLRIKQHPSVVSLYARPVVAQIVQMPKTIPNNIGQFVQTEMKQCVALAGEKTAMDYTGLTSSSGQGRLFALATDAGRVRTLVDVCQHTGIDVDVVEPALLAYARALYEQQIANKFGCNTLLLVIRDGHVTACVFREHKMDFVRSSICECEPEDKDVLGRQLSEEINAIVQYYEIDVMNNAGQWDVHIIVDPSMDFPEDVTHHMTQAMDRVNLSIWMPDNILQCLSLNVDKKVQIQDASVVAVGHALCLLQPELGIPDVNIMPQVTRELKVAKRNAVRASTVASVMFLFMGLMVMGLLMRTDKALTNIARKKPKIDIVDTTSMVEVRKQLEQRIEQIGQVPKAVKELFESKSQVNWSGFLADITDMTPESVRITRINYKGEDVLAIEGLAASYDSISIFTEKLNSSEYIVSANYSQINMRTSRDGLIPYYITCHLEERSAI